MSGAEIYDYRVQHRNNDLTALRPYLSDDLAKLLNDARQDPSTQLAAAIEPLLQLDNPGR